jgi:hypothetical protein
MPLFNLKCPACGSGERVFRNAGWKSNGDDPVRCRFCRTVMNREVQPPSTSVKETIDNGVMPKALERPADAERLHKERIQTEDALRKGLPPPKTVV